MPSSTPAASSNGKPVIVSAMEYSFIGGSMGAVVGETITRAIERATAENSAHHRLGLRRRAHDGRRRQPDAAGEDLRRAGPHGRRRRALHLRAHRSHHRRRHRLLRHAGRPQHRRTGRADRLRRAARHRADHPPEAARRLPAQRVPARSTACSTPWSIAAT